MLLYKSIKATEGCISELEKVTNVIVVIQTDGMENCSKDHTNHQLRTLISAKEELGWAFVFIGAGIDAYEQSSQFGLKSGQTMSYGLGNSKEAFASVANNTVLYAASGEVARSLFSTGQKLASGDKFDMEANK